MATQSLGKAKTPERLNDYARNKLCAEYKALEAKRKDAQSVTSGLKKRQDEIRDTLEKQLEIDRKKLIDLPRWQFGFELVDGPVKYKERLTEEIGLEAVQQFKEEAEANQVESFFLRDKGKPSAKPKTTATKKRRTRAA